MASHRATRGTLWILTIGLSCLVAGAADADSVPYIQDTDGKAVGFDGSHDVFASAGGSDFIPPSAEFLNTPADPIPVQVTSHCIMLNGTGPCGTTGVQIGDLYDGIMTLTLRASDMPAPIPEDGLLFFLSGLTRFDASNSPIYTPGDPQYDPNDVRISLDPVVSGYSFDELSPIFHENSDEAEFFYLGWRLFTGGEEEVSVTFRYEVGGAGMLNNGTPLLATNIVYAYVPEPSTALLLALGLGGLAVYRRR